MSAASSFRNVCTLENRENILVASSVCFLVREFMLRGLDPKQAIRIDDDTRVVKILLSVRFAMSLPMHYCWLRNLKNFDLLLLAQCLPFRASRHRYFALRLDCSREANSQTKSLQEKQSNISSRRRFFGALHCIILQRPSGGSWIRQEERNSRNARNEESLNALLPATYLSVEWIYDWVRC